MGNCQYLLSASNVSNWPSFSVQGQNGPHSNTITVTNKVVVYFDGLSTNVTYEVWMSLVGSKINTSIKIITNGVPSSLNVNEINNAGYEDQIQ